MPDDSGFGSNLDVGGGDAPSFGGAVQSFFGGPQYKPADPQSSALDQSADLLNQRLKRANSVATNPLAQIFAPEQVQAARNFVPKAVEQLQTIEQQRQRAADVKTTAVNWGLRNPNQFGAQATDTTLANEALRQWKDEGSFNAYKALSGLSPEWAARANLYTPDAMAKFGQHVEAVNKGIVALDAATTARSELAYKAAREKIIKENDLASIGVKPEQIPTTADGWAKVAPALRAQYNQAERSLKSFQVQQDRLGQAVPVTDEKVAGRIEGSFQHVNGETIPGFKAVQLPGYGDAQGVQGPPGSRDRDHFGQTTAERAAGSKDSAVWSTAAPEQVKTVREQLGAEEVKGAVSKYKIAREFNTTAQNPELYKSAAGLALLSDELGAVGRDVAEGSKAAGTVGLTKMLEAKYGTVDVARNRLNAELSALQEWITKGGTKNPRLSPPSIEGIKTVAQFKHDQALAEVRDRVNQPLETAGRYGIPPKNLGLDKELINSSELMSVYDNEVMQSRRTLKGYPMVPIGDRAVLLPTNSNVPGAMPPTKPIDHGAVPATSGQALPTGAPPGGSSPAIPPGGVPPAPVPSVSTPIPGAGANPQGGGGISPGGGGPAIPLGGNPPAPPTNGPAPGRTGLPPGMQLNSPETVAAAANRTIQIESGFKTGQTTGSYKGLGQWSAEEMRRHGITNPDDLEQTRAALESDIKVRAQKLAKDGLPVTPANVYLMHQQGEAGLEAHLRNPDGVAWENLRKFYKSDDVAKAAIWGNMTKDMRRQFGSVNNVTSGDFTRLWDARYNGTDSAKPSGAQLLAGGNAKPEEGRSLAQWNRSTPRAEKPSGLLDRLMSGDVPGGRATTESARQGIIEHGPAIGSTIGAAGGSIAGPVGTVAGGGAGGAAGQALSDFLKGQSQNPAELAKQGALGAVLGVAPAGRPFVGAALRAGGAGAVEAGATAAEGGTADEAIGAGVGGVGAAAGGELFGRALGMSMHKLYGLFTPSAQKSLRSAAADLHAANETLKTEQPKLPGDGGANPKYEAAKAAKEKAETAIKEIMPNAKPDEVAYAHKVAEEAIPRQEAQVGRPGAVEKERIGAGYQQLESEAGAAGVGAPKATPKLADGPIAAVENKEVSSKYAELAQRTEAAITAPAKDWQQKWVDLKDARSALLEAERDALTSTESGRSQVAKDMRTLADTVRAQQVKAAKYVFGEEGGKAVTKRLEVLDKRNAILMEATNGGKLEEAARLKGEAGRKADKAFRAFAADDPVALAAWGAMRGVKSDAERDIRTMIGVEKIPVLGKAVGLAKVATGLREWVRERTAGNPVKFSDFVPELREAYRDVRNIGGSVGARAGVSLFDNARQAPDGHYYVPDPNRKGKYLRVVH